MIKKIIAGTLVLGLLLTSMESVLGCSVPFGFVNSNSNVREKPTTSSSILKTINKGTDIEIVSKTNDWYEVIIDGNKHGYIFGELVEDEIDFYSLTEISTFSTPLDLKDDGRLVNIQYADKMTSIKLEPNEIFDFNALCNTADDVVNFEMAGMIVNKKKVLGLGGGICQVSTNIYNAIRKLGVEIIERKPHSIKVTYVTEGNDAAVSQGTKNFVFKNTLDHPIYILTYIGKSELVTKVYK